MQQCNDSRLTITSDYDRVLTEALDVKHKVQTPTGETGSTAMPSLSSFQVNDAYSC